MSLTYSENKIDGTYLSNTEFRPILYTVIIYHLILGEGLKSKLKFNDALRNFFFFNYGKKKKKTID